MLDEDFLENTIKVQRARMNITQEQLAELVGVTRKTINTIENEIMSRFLAYVNLRFGFIQKPSLLEMRSCGCSTPAGHPI